MQLGCMELDIHTDVPETPHDIGQPIEQRSGPVFFVPHCSGTVFLKVIEIFFLNRSFIALQCCVSADQQGESAIHMHISPLCHHRALRRVPCAIQLVLINYLFYTE